MKRIIPLFFALALYLGASSVHAQVSLHGVYGASPQTGLTVLFAVHNNNSVGIWLFDSNQQKVGHSEARIDTSGAFSASNVIGYSLSAMLNSTGVSSTPTITANFTGVSTFTATISRSALFGPGNAMTYEGRFEGVAALATGAHKTGVIFFIDTNMKLYFAHRRWDGSYVGGTGVVTPNSTNDGGTFLATSVDGSAISGTFTTDSFIMDGTFTLNSANYEFQAYRVSAAARLNNISTRGFVGIGSQVLIGGFTTGGGPKLVLIRVLGPSLTTFGVAGALATPTVTLVDSHQKVIATNTGWRTAANADQIARTPWVPPSDGDCAILVTLEAGAYTTLVSGVNDTTGVALVEVDELGVN